MSTCNIYFHGEIRKYLPKTPSHLDLKTCVVKYRLLELCNFITFLTMNYLFFSL